MNEGKAQEFPGLLQFFGAVARAEISSTWKLILYSLASFADKDGSCFPSKMAVAKRAGVTVRTLENHLKPIKKQGWFQAKSRTGQTTMFQLLEPCVEGAPQETHRKRFGAETDSWGQFDPTERASGGPTERDSEGGPKEFRGDPPKEIRSRSIHLRNPPKKPKEETQIADPDPEVGSSVPTFPGPNPSRQQWDNLFSTLDPVVRKFCQKKLQEAETESQCTPDLRVEWRKEVWDFATGQDLEPLSNDWRAYSADLKARARVAKPEPASAPPEPPRKPQSKEALFLDSYLQSTLHLVSSKLIDQRTAERRFADFEKRQAGDLSVLAIEYEQWEQVHGEQVAQALKGQGVANG